MKMGYWKSTGLTREAFAMEVGIVLKRTDCFALKSTDWLAHMETYGIDQMESWKDIS